MPGYESQKIVRDRLKTIALRDVEGLWEFPVNGTVIAIERDDETATRFKIVAVESPFMMVDNGLLLGYAYPTTKANIFDASLSELKQDGTIKNSADGKPRKFTLTLNESDALIFKPVKKGWAVNWDWWRLFPYMFRFRVDKVDEKPKDLEGALRIWPKSLTVPPRQPRYL